MRARRAIRVLAGITIALLALYYVMRTVASRCAGTGCEIYIPLSLLLPFLILAVAFATGVAAISDARGSLSWVSVLVAVTVLGAAGPIVSAIALRDNPDLLVPLATALVVLIPLVALSYTVLRPESNEL